MTWIGVHNAIISTAYHAAANTKDLFQLHHDWMFTMCEIREHTFFFFLIPMFVVLKKTLYALIQQHSDPCLLLSSRYVSVLLLNLQHILDFSGEGYPEFAFYSLSPLK